MNNLPIQPHATHIQEEIEKTDFLLIDAPTGTGKSTQVPVYIRDWLKTKNKPGRVLVLEPRRLVTVGLAARVAEETGAIMGKSIGYQVRGKSETGLDTEILFQTYGFFLRHLLSNPLLTGVAAIIFDEFHERSLDMDAALVWAAALKRLNKNLSLKIIFLSATLNAKELRVFFPPLSVVRVEAKAFPVEIGYLPPIPGEPVWKSSHRAFRRLDGDGHRGTILVFFPGKFEIARFLEELVKTGPKGWIFEALHGGLSLIEQKKILSSTTHPENRIIACTNIAESSLTVPDVTAVIDSGLVRESGYSESAGIQTLYISRISKASMAQRAGRAGRTQAGSCIRLWRKDTEKWAKDFLVPEILRSDLMEFQFQLRHLSKSAEIAWAEFEDPRSWLVAPDTARWGEAEKELRELKILSEEGILCDQATKLIGFPLNPRLGSVLLGFAEKGLFEEGKLQIALTSSVPNRPWRGDIVYLAEKLSRVSRSGWPPQVLNVYDSLPNFSLKNGSTKRGAGIHDFEIMSSIWIQYYHSQLGQWSGTGKRYHFKDGRSAELEGMEGETPEFILALSAMETGGGGKNLSRSAGHWIAARLEWLELLFPENCKREKRTAWDEAKRTFWIEKIFIFRGRALVLGKAPPGPDDCIALEEGLAEKIQEGEIRPSREEAKPLLARYELLQRTFPELDLKPLDQEAWHFIHLLLCQGKKNAQEVEDASLSAAVEEYLGSDTVAKLWQEFPESLLLPSGKKARYHYSPGGPPELSARLGDFIGLTGKQFLGNGRVTVVFDILAPNYRTVQKTDDLSGFWKITYPEVKKELKRRYPKHPWP